MSTPLWSNVVKESPIVSLAKGAELPPKSAKESKSSPAFPLSSTDKPTTAVIDANAVIDGAESLNGIADRFVTVPEVLSEIRDPNSRNRLSIFPFSLETMEPTPESISKVIKFAKSTGDLQTLSDVDVKLIALTYTLEAQSHGTAHLREAPPPIQTIKVRRLPEKQMPGWGSTGSEWDALEKGDSQDTHPNSRILSSKPLDLDSVTLSEEENPIVEEPKKEVNLEGKKMVAEGIDASMGEHNESEEWAPAVSRSTRRRYLRRKARHELYNQKTDEKEEQEDEEALKALQQMGIEDIEEEEPIAQSASSVACITGDFSMQNVILQMGLRLSAPGGRSVKQLHRWVLKCHACFTVTTETGRIFCPKCGNGGTLRKVAVTVNEDGVVLADRKPRVILRGTKFSLPSPKGGRDGISKNPILREDQLPQKFMNPKPKKSNKEDDFYTIDSVFSSHHDKNAAFKPPIRQAMAMFGGRRNPNDNHYSIRKR